MIKKLFVGLGLSLAVFATALGLYVTVASAAPSVFTVDSGGTGWGKLNTGYVLYGNGTGKVSTTTALFENTIGNLLFTYGSTTALTATSIYSTTASTSNLTISNIQSALLKTGSTGIVAAAVAGTDYITPTNLAAAFPFTSDLNYGALTNSTTTAVWFKSGLQASSTSQFVYASSTALTVSGTGYFGTASTSNLTISGISGCSSTQALTTNSSGVVACGSITSSATFPFLATTNYGAAANSTSTPIWFTAGLQASSTSQIAYASTTAITATTASTTDLYVSSLLNGLHYGNSVGKTLGTTTLATNFGGTGQNTNTWSGLALTTAGVWSQYAGSNPCTNQVALSISASGVISCTSVTNAMLSNSSLTINTTGGLTGGGSVALGASLTLNAPAWPFTATTNYGAAANSTSTIPLWLQAGLQASSTSQIAYASTTAISASGGLYIPNTSSQAPTVTGQLAQDTTDNQLVLGTGAATAVFDSRRFFSFGYATSSWSATTTFTVAPYPVAGTITKMTCTTNVGTVNVDLYYGPTPTHLALFNASTTAGVVSFSGSNTPGAAASSTVAIGTPASAPTSIGCTGTYTITGT